MIFKAAKSGNIYVLKKLHQKDVDLHQKNTKGYTILGIAIANGHQKIIDWLLLHCGFQINEVGIEAVGSALTIAISFNQIEIVHKLIREKFSDPNEQDSYGRTPLMFAAIVGNLNIIQFLVNDCGVSVEDKNLFRDTALTLATEAEHVEVVKWFILEAKAQVSVRNREGKTLLLIASTRGNLSVARWLLERGDAHINERDYNGNTALLLAAMNGRSAVIEWLLVEGGAQINDVDLLGNTAFLLAYSHGHMQVAHRLLSKGPRNEREKNIDSFNLLARVISIGRLDVVKHLLSQNPNELLCGYKHAQDAALAIASSRLPDFSTAEWGFLGGNDNPFGDTLPLLSSIRQAVSVWSSFEYFYNTSFYYIPLMLSSDERRLSLEVYLQIAANKKQLPIWDYLIRKHNLKLDPSLQHRYNTISVDGPIGRYLEILRLFTSLTIDYKAVAKCITKAAQQLNRDELSYVYLIYLWREVSTRKALNSRAVNAWPKDITVPHSSISLQHHKEIVNHMINVGYVPTDWLLLHSDLLLSNFTFTEKQAISLRRLLEQSQYKTSGFNTLQLHNIPFAQNGYERFLNLLEHSIEVPILENLHTLNLQKCDLASGAMEKLLSVLIKLKNLKHLNLDDNNLNYKDLMSLLQALRSVASTLSLNSLSVRFNNIIIKRMSTLETLKNEARDISLIHLEGNRIVQEFPGDVKCSPDKELFNSWKIEHRKRKGALSKIMCLLAKEAPHLSVGDFLTAEASSFEDNVLYLVLMTSMGAEEIKLRLEGDDFQLYESLCYEELDYPKSLRIRDYKEAFQYLLDGINKNVVSSSLRNQYLPRPDSLVHERKTVCRELLTYHRLGQIKDKLKSCTFFSSPKISEAPSRLYPNTRLTLGQGRIYFMANSTIKFENNKWTKPQITEHNYLGYEYLTNSGQIQFGVAHLVTPGEGKVKVLLKNSKEPQSLLQEHSIASFTAPTCAIKDMSKAIKNQARLEYLPDVMYQKIIAKSSYNTATDKKEVTNCLVWIIDTMNQHLNTHIGTEELGWIPSLAVAKLIKKLQYSSDVLGGPKL